MVLRLGMHRALLKSRIDLDSQLKTWPGTEFSNYPRKEAGQRATTLPNITPEARLAGKPAIQRNFSMLEHVRMYTYISPLLLLSTSSLFLPSLFLLLVLSFFLKGRARGDGEGEARTRARGERREARRRGGRSQVARRQKLDARERRKAGGQGQEARGEKREARG